MPTSPSRARRGVSALRSSLARVVCGFVLATGAAVQAAPIVQDFESFSSGDSVGGAIAGLTFTNATIGSAGLSLNEIEFPPQSGSNAVIDIGGAITIVFATPVNLVGAFLTYAAPLTLEAYDSASNLLGSVSGAFGSNYVTSGNAPNEFLSLSSASGISRVVFTADPAGGSFVLDDLTYDRRSGGGTVPLPGTALLLVAAVAAAGAARRHRSN